MAWTVPTTWVAGVTVGATDLNSNIRDNMNFVFNGKAFASLLYFAAGNYSGGALASFTNVDSTNLSLSLTVATGRVQGYWLFRCSIDNAAHNAVGYFSTWADGATVDGGSNNSGIESFAGGVEVAQWVLLPFAFTGLSAAVHTFKLIWRNDSSAGINQTIAASAAIGIRGMAWEF